MHPTPLHARRPRLPLRATVLAALLAVPSLAQATHFRYATYTWDRANLLSSTGAALNDAGNAVGGATFAQQLAAQTAFITDGTALNQFAAPPSRPTWATGINQGGEWVGYFFNIANSSYRGVYHNGTAAVYVTALGGNDTRFAAINAAGVAVGTAELPGGDERGFIYDGQGIQQLPTLGGTWSEASAINAAGQVVGRSANALERPEAFIFQGNVMTSLGTLGGNASRAYAINDRGDVVGASNYAAFGPNSAFVWRRGQMTALGTLGGSFSEALAINHAGLAVGSATDIASATRAFVGGVQGMHDLNRFLAAAPAAGEVLTAATAINRHGQILANTVANRAVLLTPEGQLRWNTAGQASFTDGGAWDSGVGQGPSRFLDLVLAHPASQTVEMSEAAEVRSLVIGAAGGADAGQMRLRLSAGATLTALQGIVVERSGILAGDGTIAGNLELSGTMQVGCGFHSCGQTGRTFQDRTYVFNVNRGGLVTGSGVLEAALNVAAGGEVQAGAGQVLRLLAPGGAAHISSGVLEVRNGGELRVGGVWRNRLGTVRIDGGTLRFEEGLDNHGQVHIGFGGASLFGRVDNQVGAGIVASGGSEATVWDALTNNGEVRASAGSRIVYFGPVNGAGSFSTNGAGAYHRFEGGYAPGNSAADVVLGDTELASLLTMEVGGTLPGTEHDRISFTGSLLLDVGAVLDVVLLGGFVPAAGQVFDLFVFSQPPQGSFTSLHLPALAGGLVWDTHTLYIDGDLRVAAVPEPAAAWLLAVGGVALLLRRRLHAGRRA